MADIRNQLESVLGFKRIAEKEVLSEHTVLKKNGVAQWYIAIDKVDELIRLVQKAKTLGVPTYVLGSGALSVPTKDVAGLVIKNNCRRFDKMSMKGKITGGQMGIENVMVSAEAGVLMNQLVRFTIEEGLEGLEYQLGMPGTVGGAIYTDASYKEHFVREHLVSMRIINKKGEVEMHTHDFPFLGKRKERWHEPNIVILSAVFSLTPQDKKILWGRGSEAVDYRSKYSERHGV